MTFKEIFQRVRMVHPDAPETYVKSLANDCLRDMRKYRVVRKQAKFDTISGQRWYNIGDTNSDLKVDKILWVAYKDSGGNYRKIPRLIDPEAIINVDVT